MKNTKKTSRRDAEFTQKKSFNLTQISQISQKAMRHDYPHAEAQRAQRSHREFIVFPLIMISFFRTRIYRIPRIDDDRLLTPPLAALTPPLRWEGS